MWRLSHCREKFDRSARAASGIRGEPVIFSSMLRLDSHRFLELGFEALVLMDSPFSLVFSSCGVVCVAGRVLGRTCVRVLRGRVLCVGSRESRGAPRLD